MNCPLCINQVLEPNHRSGIEIDVCPKCKGVWLDRGEIDKLAADPDTEPRIATHQGPTPPQPPQPQSARPSPGGHPRPPQEWDDAGWERPRSDKPQEGKKNKKDKKDKKPKRRKSLAERLGDALEDALDL